MDIFRAIRWQAEVFTLAGPPGGGGGPKPGLAGQDGGAPEKGGIVVLGAQGGEGGRCDKLLYGAI